MNATLHDPETDELLAEIECTVVESPATDVRPWQAVFSVVEEHTPLERGAVMIKLEDGRVARATVTSVAHRSFQLRPSGSLVGSGPLD